MKMRSIAIIGFCLGGTSIGFAKSSEASAITLQKDINVSQNFGSLAVGSSAAFHWNLRAKELDLHIQSIDLEGEGFSLETNCSELLPAKQKCTLGITFAPTHQGSHRAMLVVDLYTDRFLIQLSGEGTEPTPPQPEFFRKTTFVPGPLESLPILLYREPSKDREHEDLQ